MPPGPGKPHPPPRAEGPLRRQVLAAAAPTPRRRRIKVRGGSLGSWLCWAVVFADIGTSVYYVPGILYRQFGTRSALFVGLTLVVFVLLTIKYAEVAWRYPEGGGVVTVASRALHPFVGLLGGLLILVDYYLTAALSALSGVIYLAVVIPGLAGPAVSAATIGALLALGLLNLSGIRESARASALVAALAAAGQLVVVLAVMVHLGPQGIVSSFGRLGAGAAPLTPVILVSGFAFAFLAFSGLESIAQIAPAMREPRRAVASRAMLLVVVSMALTSPLLTLWSTTLLDGSKADPNQFISLLGLEVSGAVLGSYVAVSAALLLIFASNTAIIGAYHVFIALARMGFLPRAVERRNRLRQTPHVAIILAVALPVAVVAGSGANVDLLGDLYAFGLLGAFVLTCFALDVVRWRDRAGDGSRRARAGFALGVATTVLVLIAWLTNLIAKPLATEFGGALTGLGLVVGFVTYRRARRSRPPVFPVPYRPERAAASIRALRMGRPDVLVVLPHHAEAAEAVIAEAIRAAAGKRVVFMYRGRLEPGESALLELADPYLKDYPAQDAFARAESLARRRVPERGYIYVPGNLRREVVGDVWKQVEPRETVISDGDLDVLPPIALSRVRRHVADGTVVLHLLTGRMRRAAG